MKGIPVPASSLLIKLGSIAVHTEELLEQGDVRATAAATAPFDLSALDVLLTDPEVAQWCEEMDALALLPVKRDA